jgi:hypothetical protein
LVLGNAVVAIDLTPSERRTHDHTRHGTLTRFATPDAAIGKAIERCYARHGGREFPSSLREIERNVPPELEVRLIMDNSATRKTRTIQKWLGARDRDGMFTSPALPVTPTRPKRLLGCLLRSFARRFGRFPFCY